MIYAMLFLAVVFFLTHLVITASRKAKEKEEHIAQVSLDHIKNILKKVKALRLNSRKINVIEWVKSTIKKGGYRFVFTNWKTIACKTIRQDIIGKKVYNWIYTPLFPNSIMKVDVQTNTVIDFMDKTVFENQRPRRPPIEDFLG